MVKNFKLTPSFLSLNIV